MAAGKTNSKKSSSTGARLGTGSSARKNSEIAKKARLREEILAIICIAVAAFLIFALFVSAAGKLGEFFSTGLKGLFGDIAYVLPFVLIVYGVLLFARRTALRGLRSGILVIVIFFMLTVICSGFYLHSGSDPMGGAKFSAVFEQSAQGKSGGILGMYTGWLLITLIGKPGLFIFAFVLLIISLLLLINTPLSPYVAAWHARRKKRKEELYALREEEIRRGEETLSHTDSRAAGNSKTINATDARLPAEVYTEDARHADFEEIHQGSPKPENAGAGFFGFLRNRKNIIASVNSEFEDAETDAESQNDSRNVLDADMLGTDALGVNSPLQPPAGVGLEPADPPRPGYGMDGHVLPFANGNVAAATENQQSPSETSTSVFSAEYLRGASGTASPVAYDSFASAHSEGETDFTMEDLKNDLRGAPPPFISDRDSSGEIQPGVGTLAPKTSAKPKKASGEIDFDRNNALANYKLPSVELLNKSKKTEKTQNTKELQFQAQRLEQTLRDFRVEARVINVTVGPSVTRYEVEPDVGVKIQSIKSLEADLARSLEVKSVRVVTMPGQSVVGIEAFNANTTLVTLREIIDSSDFRALESKVAFALGMDISGNRVIADLAAMPHLLIAGTTGSGKSVCINSILLSILYRARPDEVKLILVDPKVVELKSYNDVPHLLLPVVTEPERAATALAYAVTIMEDRFRKMSENDARELKGYNERMRKEGLYEEIMPQIVIVIDELSDLMMTAPAKVQESITRLAAMGRAAGMHLVVATQQPLASILTSVIKANIPSRIAFSVASGSHSRVILDETGAERLHGHGDMLFSPVGTREPKRIQGAFVSDSEVHKVTEYVKKGMDPDYSPDILQIVSGDMTGQLVDDGDEFFRDAVEMVVQTKQASVSMIQRRFRIGYNRAARLVDMMEERGIVASSEGPNKPRRVLMTEEQLADFFGTAVQVRMEIGGTRIGMNMDDGMSSDMTDDGIPGDFDDTPPFEADDEDIH